MFHRTGSQTGVVGAASLVYNCWPEAVVERAGLAAAGMVEFEVESLTA